MITDHNFTAFTEELAKFFRHYYADGTWMIGQEGDTPTFTQKELQLGILKIIGKYDIPLPKELHDSTNQIIHVEDISSKEESKK